MTSASHHTLTRLLSTAPGFLAGHVISRDVPEIIHTELMTGVTVIYVSPGNVFPAHISLGIRVSPHTYH